ncbi:two-component system chemotaxis response regulator CheB [Rubricella aquisinus]|uniref:Protein-glutamate methylesterase/protein-glutamine glutaminase n=1 Tax=Rubricella aquisinus TaxID=2028108 RepID=A0A840WSK8_9RHOB|nr:chemotaxis response regulator protein-glutamate methylesterase [Rubricella aquisinus]MBB5516652.1 two-component system chemotaxis response regulator CheB [Rubricella aquisinus]
MIRVLIVDDSRLMRSMIRQALSSCPDIDVVAEAPDPHSARQLIKDLNPDVLTLDVEMPGMDGITFLQKIMDLRPMPVIMVSTLTDQGTDTAIAAMELGAVDAVPKPGGNLSLPGFGRLLADRIRMAAKASVRRQAAPPPQPQAGVLPKVDVIAIGASTGGVSAIGAVLQHIPPDAPPVVIVQHMPEAYTGRFADRLDKQLRVHVSEAQDGETLRPGTVRIAPGGAHLRFRKTEAGLRTRLEQSAPVSGHCPSVDVMFHALAETGVKCRAALLTGMGRDGADGLLRLYRAGHTCLVQDKASCVVFGMPRVAIELGAASEILPLDHLGARLFTKSQDRARHTARAS